MRVCARPAARGTVEPLLRARAKLLPSALWPGYDVNAFYFGVLRRVAKGSTGGVTVEAERGRGREGGSRVSGLRLADACGVSR